MTWRVNEVNRALMQNSLQNRNYGDIQITTNNIKQNKLILRNRSPVL